MTDNPNKAEEFIKRLSDPTATIYVDPATGSYLTDEAKKLIIEGLQISADNYNKDNPPEKDSPPPEDPPPVELPPEEKSPENPNKAESVVALLNDPNVNLHFDLDSKEPLTLEDKDLVIASLNLLADKFKKDNPPVEDPPVDPLPEDGLSKG